jgi:hypothetical protein
VATRFVHYPPIIPAIRFASPIPPVIGAPMAIIATIMNTRTGQPIQKMTFGRMPKPWVSFNLATGELVTADRVHIGKPAPGKVVTPVEVWVSPKD